VRRRGSVAGAVRLEGAESSAGVVVALRGGP
jgi:hypothetical protein